MPESRRPWAAQFLFLIMQRPTWLLRRRRGTGGQVKGTESPWARCFGPRLGVALGTVRRNVDAKCGDSLINFR